MADRTVDFAAVGRVANRIELKTIRLAEVTAKCDHRVVGGLEPSVDFDCAVSSREGGALEIACNYRFSVRTTQAQAAEAVIKYLVEYEVRGNEPLAEADLAEFAFANGTVHSWPFVREFLYGLTSRMGYPPYTLPVFHFKPKPQEKKEAEKKPAPSKESSVPESTA